MARPKKIGLDYFPFDVDFFDDIKVRKLIRRQGGKAVAVYALLLCFIYKNGYYMGSDEELPFIIAEKTGYDEAYIQQVINNLFSLGFFDKTLYENHNIITSKGVQIRYSEVQKSRKANPDVSKFNLISGVNSEETPVNSEETPVNSEETPVNSEESTQKESKEKESKEKKRGIDPPLTPPLIVEKNWRNDFQIYFSEVSEDFKNLMDDEKFIKDREKYFPHVDIRLSLEKTFKDFWGTEAGWYHKKKSKTAKIDWKATFRNSLDQKFNQIYKPGNYDRNNSAVQTKPTTEELSTAVRIGRAIAEANKNG